MLDYKMQSVHLVVLLAEDVDRNIVQEVQQILPRRRPPRGGRG